jgi:hypothetical protein
MMFSAPVIIAIVIVPGQYSPIVSTSVSMKALPNPFNLPILGPILVRVIPPTV